MGKTQHGFGKRFAKWTTNTVESIDRFGIPISLHFKQDTEFKTAIGGCTSILLLIGLAVYAGLLLKQLINKDNRGIFNYDY